MASRKYSEKFEWEVRGFRQEALKAAIELKPVVFAIGCAGTGKSLVTTYCALDLLDRGIKGGGVSRIVVTRPLVTVGEDLGALPGDLSDKIDPYLAPIMELIKDSGHPDTQELLDPVKDHTRIQGVPVALMRGMTFTNSFVIVDEAQNLTRPQMKMLLTRLGENSKMVFTGDQSQTDLKTNQSGLMHAVEMFRHDPAVEVIEFGIDDIQRHDFVGRVIKSYAEDSERFRLGIK